MITLQQQAGLFNVFGVTLVTAMSLVTYRFRPDPVYRSWVHSYAWGILTASSSAAIAFWGIAWSWMTILTVFSAVLDWWMFRMADQLLERPFNRAGTTALVVLPTLACQVIWLAGLPLKAAIGPAALLVVGAHLRLGWVMVQVGKGSAWRGLGWMGITVIAAGLWICTYPFVVDTPYHWIGHLIDACLEIGVGAGMVTYIMIRTMQQLEELDRLKHEFLSAAAHELRTPLTSVMGYAEFLSDGLGGPLTGQQGEFVGHIQRGVQRLRRITDEMLDIARVQAGTFELEPGEADLAAIVRDETLSLVPMAREREVALTVGIGAVALPVLVDAPRIGQVVLNLVSNALKFTPAGGRVEVEVTCEPAGYRVEVRDTGIGIDPTHQHRLFEKFYQVDTGTRRAHGGAGLGLTIAKSLVEAHGGTIGVTSRAGGGSTFWFTLPQSGRLTG